MPFLRDRDAFPDPGEHGRIRIRTICRTNHIGVATETRRMIEDRL